MKRPEYPRPQFVREDWLSLNGEWEFDFDDTDAGERERWYAQGTLARRIQVPFCFQSELSGIGETGFHDIVWYRKQVTLPEAFAGKRIVLHFGAVDYSARVWVNGQLAAMHEGGHTPFSADITLLLQPGANTIAVRAQDYGQDLALPRGKQYWKEHSESIFYTRTTGIWQSVWLEPVDVFHLGKVKLTPDIDNDLIHITPYIDGPLATADVRLTTIIKFKGELVAEEFTRITQSSSKRSIQLGQSGKEAGNSYWSPANPHLYDVEFVLTVDGQETDRVQSYFGMRKISVERGKLCLNNRPYYMKLVLDQGYFPKGILTAPTDEALRQDVELTKAMGFNGARKHQKIEDPRYMYWCDKLGLLVWGEMANSYLYTDTYVERMQQEWMEAIHRDYNHPCIVAWVPINESWGVQQVALNQAQQHHARAMYHMTKSFDSTRPVMSNDGWEHVKSDLCTIHDYESREEVLRDRYATLENAIGSDPCKRVLHVEGAPYQDEPILVTEFGGISFRKSEWEGWGYSAASDDADFLTRLEAVVRPLLQSPVVQGFCYTQLTDVEQEINGLLTYDRQVKVPLEWIRLINEGKALPPEAKVKADA